MKISLGSGQHTCYSYCAFQWCNLAVDLVLCNVMSIEGKKEHTPPACGLKITLPVIIKNYEMVYLTVCMGCELTA